LVPGRVTTADDWREKPVQTAVPVFVIYTRSAAKSALTSFAIAVFTST